MNYFTTSHNQTHSTCEYALHYTDMSTLLSVDNITSSGSLTRHQYHFEGSSALMTHARKHGVPERAEKHKNTRSWFGEIGALGNEERAELQYALLRLV
jgi:hypothetical protein